MTATMERPDRSTELYRGQIVRLRSLSHYPTNLTTTRFDYTPGAKRVFVCIVLGTELIDGSELLDADKELEAMGWLWVGNGLAT